MPRAVLQPFLITAVVGLVALFGYWVQAPWLIPSVGASAFIQLLLPDKPAGQAYDTGVGQLVGMVAGFASVLVTGAAAAPVMSETHGIALVRVGAVVLAVFLTSAVQVPLKALSAAGAAVAVLIAAGVASTSWASFGVIAASIGLVTVLGEVARRTLLAVER
ncbi:hypothetical protein D3273_10815 [Lichenibacterium minor]|uniref:HPP transmembrane region domain-containing protein n=1 Tax=Lichenibacterium minor TaxID=2316528 RepID=A0A4Q2UAJ8_9HYPH|nr:HPP family protein [Lichenibacterium minor]RYC31915.1 hypothetical protein D3273_10815 [Lichenibacterium minor]